MLKNYSAALALTIFMWLASPSIKAQPVQIGMGQFLVGPDSIKIENFEVLMRQGYYNLNYYLIDTTAPGDPLVLDTTIFWIRQSTIDISVKNLTPGHGYLFTIIVVDSVGNDNRNWDFTTPLATGIVVEVGTQDLHVYQCAQNELCISAAPQLIGKNLQLHDLQGRQIFTKTISECQQTWTVNFPPGIYIASCSNRAFRITFRP